VAAPPMMSTTYPSPTSITVKLPHVIFRLSLLILQDADIKAARCYYDA
jgi:hypothetical protein